MCDRSSGALQVANLRIRQIGNLRYGLGGNFAIGCLRARLGNGVAGEAQAFDMEFDETAERSKDGFVTPAM